jgi:hypothetical protein
MRIDEILASVETLSAAEIERLWIDEAVRRDEEIDRGATQLQPADEVLARAHRW